MIFVSEKQASDRLREHVASWKLLPGEPSQDLLELGAFISSGRGESVCPQREKGKSIPSEAAGKAIRGNLGGDSPVHTCPPTDPSWEWPGPGEHTLDKLEPSLLGACEESQSGNGRIESQAQQPQLLQVTVVTKPSQLSSEIDQAHPSPGSSGIVRSVTAGCRQHMAFRNSSFLPCIWSLSVRRLCHRNLQ